MSTLSNDAFTLFWFIGAAVLVAALFTLLGGRKPGQRRPGRPSRDGA
jgi:hypothetical protein